MIPPASSDPAGAPGRSAFDNPSTQVEPRIPLTESALLYRLYGGSGQLGNDEHALRQLVAGEPCAESLEDRILRQRGPGLRHDHGGHSLAEIRVRYAEHRALQHTGQGIELELHFLRIDVEAAADHQILDPTDDMNVAVAIDSSEIAALETAVRGEFTCCL